MLPTSRTGPDRVSCWRRRRRGQRRTRRGRPPSSQSVTATPCTSRRRSTGRRCTASRWPSPTRSTGLSATNGTRRCCARPRWEVPSTRARSSIATARCGSSGRTTVSPSAARAPSGRNGCRAMAPRSSVRRPNSLPPTRRGSTRTSRPRAWRGSATPTGSCTRVTGGTAPRTAWGWRAVLAQQDRAPSRSTGQSSRHVWRPRAGRCGVLS